MTISSTAFTGNQLIPAKYTCDGQNVSPELAIADVPEKAQSLVLICDDPDAPMGTWTHWTVWNINPKINKIEENSVPEGAIEGKTSQGDSGYHGPCPPSGTHRYYFKIYALDIKLNLHHPTDKAELEEALSGHILKQAELIGVYRRSG